MREAHPDDDHQNNMEYMVMGNKAKVLVKIFIIDEDEEGDIVRQFVVEANSPKDGEGSLALRINELIEKKFDVDNVEAWTI
jgi:hypothetical protein